MKGVEESLSTVILREAGRVSTRESMLATGQLNPTWVEWLMGFPLGWTDLGPSATRSFRKSSSTSGDG
jgi:hypothetical protein